MAPKKAAAPSKKSATKVGPAATTTSSAQRGRARTGGNSSNTRSTIKTEPEVAKKKTTPPPKPKRGKTSGGTDRKKRNSSEVDSSLFKDVQVVLQRIKNTPMRTVPADEVFERLEEVKRSPLRVNLVFKDLVREAADEEIKVVRIVEEPASKTPTGKMVPPSKRMTRSAKKVAPPSPVKGREMKLTYCTIITVF